MHGDTNLNTQTPMQGEETWAFMPAAEVLNGSEAGYLYLRNDLGGSIIELDRGDVAGYTHEHTLALARAHARALSLSLSHSHTYTHTQVLRVPRAPVG